MHSTCGDSLEMLSVLTQASFVQRHYSVSAHDIEMHPSLNILASAGMALKPQIFCAAPA